MLCTLVVFGEPDFLRVRTWRFPCWIDLTCVGHSSLNVPLHAPMELEVFSWSVHLPEYVGSGGTTWYGRRHVLGLSCASKLLSQEALCFVCLSGRTVHLGTLCPYGAQGFRERGGARLRSLSLERCRCDGHRPENRTGTALKNEIVVSGTTAITLYLRHRRHSGRAR